MNNTEEFLNKYKEMEKIIRDQEDLKDEDSVLPAIRRRIFYSEVKYCSDIRNLLSHNPPIKLGEYPIDVNPSTISFIKDVITQLKTRKRCRDICVPKTNIYSCTMNDKIKPAIEVMKREIFTLVPIVENGVVIGVFDENSLLERLLHDEIAELNNTDTFESIKDYLSLDRVMEKFIFVKQDMLVEDLCTLVKEKTEDRIRISGIFLTAHGNPKEKIVGLLTPWDLPQ